MNQETPMKLVASWLAHRKSITKEAPLIRRSNIDHATGSLDAKSIQAFALKIK